MIARSVFILIGLAAVLAAQTPAPEKFKMTAGGGAATATEEFVLEKTQNGYRVAGEVKVRQGAAEVVLEYEETLAEDWAPSAYRLTRTRGAEQRSLTLTCEGGRAELRGGPAGERTESAGPQLVILDNAIAAHAQILLHRLAARGGARDWTVAVPQVGLFAPGVLTSEGTALATFEGLPVEVRRYSLETAGQRMELFAEARTNRLMKISVPFQSAETVREGFVLAEAVMVRRAPCEESEVRIAARDLELPGTLCMPRGEGVKRAVVLVHGSGPSDRDDTFGPNKPLRDLAYGLAEGGIASLRYDKRTFVDPKNADRLTLEQEVVDDAAAAVELLLRQPGVDTGGVYIVGHSLGAMLAPRIARSSKVLRGMILLGAGARPFDEIVLGQVESQSRQEGRSESAIEAQIAKMREFFTRVRSGRTGEGELLMGASAQYWRELLAIDVPASLAGLKVPALVLHGGKDVQVGREDHDLLRAALARRGSACDRAEWLPDHNHLFMKFDGAATTAAYGRAGQVDPAVIRIIAEWIHRCGAEAPVDSLRVPPPSSELR